MATSTYLQNTHTGTGSSSGAKSTMSVWIKRTDILGDSRSTIIGARTDDNNYFKVRFADNDRLMVFGLKSGSGSINIETDAEFRDIFSWYHVVLQIDTTSSTETERVKWYVNGELQTIRTSGRDYPSQNDVNHLTSASDINIGCNAVSSPNEHFDGTMSHFHMIDGTIYPPTAFGSTDSTTGEWKINTSPSVTYGAKGYFILKDGNSVTDASGKGNNFTVAAGALTNTKDCPSNVFATWNSLVPLTTNYVYLNGNTSVNQTSGSWKKTVSTIGVNSGKWYWEISATNAQISAGKYTVIGVATTTDATAPSGMSPRGIGMKSNGTVAISTSTVATLSVFELGDIISCYLDMDNGALYYAKNGSMLNSGNPTSGSSKTGAFSLPYATETHFAYMAPYGTNNKAEANFGNGFFGTTAVTTNSGNGYAGAEGASKFKYQPPSGYSALNTKGLNQ